jgi:hypothetical protein
MSLFTSRKFWVALVALAVIILQSFLPNFTINQDLLVDGIVILSAYVVSLAIDPGDPGAKILSMVGSRRFWIALISIIVLSVQVVNPAFQLDQELMTAYLLVVVPVIVGLAIDPRKDGNKWKALLTDRKFYTAFVGVFLVVLDSLHLTLPFNLTPDQVVAACVAFGGYIAALSLEKKNLSIVPSQRKY